MIARNCPLVKNSTAPLKNNLHEEKVLGGLRKEWVSSNFMQVAHSYHLNETPMCVCRERLGEEISYIVARFDLQNLHLPISYQVLGETEYVRLDVFSSIGLDEARFHLGDAGRVIFKQPRWKFQNRQRRILPHQIVHSAQPN